MTVSLTLLAVDLDCLNFLPLMLTVFCYYLLAVDADCLIFLAVVTDWLTFLVVAR